MLKQPQPVTYHFGLVILEDGQSILHIDDVGLGIQEAGADGLKLTLLHHSPAQTWHMLGFFSLMRSILVVLVYAPIMLAGMSKKFEFTSLVMSPDIFVLNHTFLKQ